MSDCRQSHSSQLNRSKFGETHFRWRKGRVPQYILFVVSPIRSDWRQGLSLEYKHYFSRQQITDESRIRGKAASSQSQKDDSNNGEKDTHFSILKDNKSVVLQRRLRKGDERQGRLTGGRD